MAIRTLPDGSQLDTETGDMIVGNVAREAAARRASANRGFVRAPVVNKGQQIMEVRQVNSHANVIAPVQTLNVSPRSVLDGLSDGSKKMLLTGLIAAAAFGAVWLNNKMKKQKAHNPSKYYKGKK